MTRFFVALSCCLTAALVLPGCGDGSTSSSGDSAQSPGGRSGGRSSLANSNREWIATLEQWTQTVGEAADIFAQITDNDSAEARVDRLEALGRKVRSEQGEWQFSQFGTAFDSDELLGEWEEAERAYEAERARLDAERGRVQLAARDRTPMMDALYAFPY